MIYFKESYLREEFEKLNGRLIKILKVMDALLEMKFGIKMVITSVYRPDPESPHMYFRAADARPGDLEHKHCKYIEHLMNMVFLYDKDQYQTVIYHNRGSGWHFHVQVKP